ncbi:MAG: hypothetical protein IJC80_04645 [Clostridia bacterium]|nr:hypothetical protein [Clostridia bacterium]
MKNKKYLSIFVIILSLILSAFIFNACQGNTTDTSSDSDEEACAHEWSTQSSVAPTCDEDGYSIKKCDLCDKRELMEYDPLGHSFTESYEWDFERGMVTGTITCSRCNKFYSSNSPSVTDEIIYSTCKTKGKYILSATFILNGREYVDKKEVELPIGECIYEYYSLSLAKDNCADGYTRYGECITCGKKIATEGRTHDLLIEETVKLDEFGACGGTATRKSCPCGQNQTYTVSKYCDGRHIKTNQIIDTVENGKSIYMRTTACALCGIEHYLYKEGIPNVNNILTEEALTINGEEIFRAKNYIHKNERGHTLSATVEPPIYGTCELGYIVMRSCNECDYTERVFLINENHTSGNKELIKDFGEHGQLYLFECHCGAYKHLELLDFQSQHGLDRVGDNYECISCDFKCVRLYKPSLIGWNEMYYFAVLDENGEIDYEYSAEETE